ncbi:TonB system transport protein ExbD [Janthinobacterium fluminis]|uniref:Biopolymer transport protein ExbD n=1 Tax=Janthinobacterium fluminis TaxID=2987524 RepID=A0ABT5K2L1_9BURK|nr:TonB system transport protein ExbD [Janthinobacterium fluminis]MDC8759212.1 TonB system transport protein ExbD [Janthinobacterium fluminis]
MGAFFPAQDEDMVEVHEINVTPFIDVMLVLLIIFMVVSPLATVDLKIDLPAASAQPEPRPDKPVFISLKADRSLYLAEQPVSLAQLGGQLDAQTGADRQTTLFFQADKRSPYEDVMAVMDALRKAGYLKVGLVGREAE